MKKFVVSFLIGLVACAGLGAGVVADSACEYFEVVESVSRPEFVHVDDYLLVEVAEASAYLLREGYPCVLQLGFSQYFPLGSQVSVDVAVEYVEYVLSKPLLPTPLRYGGNDVSVTGLHDRVSVMTEGFDVYPEQPYVISDTVGLHDGERMRMISVKVFPRYYPKLDVLQMPSSVSIVYNYVPCDDPVAIEESYDLLIITDASFEAALQPLVTHKQSMGVETLVMTTQEIYSAYDGRDDPEDIKLCIKDMVESHGIQYVLLAGGRKGQSFDWYIPERRTNNDDGWEGGYASDLYYADIYKIDGNDTVFEDWDSNGNGIFAEWAGIPSQRDIMDYHPDVGIGRLPFRYAFEIPPVVDKIITYETSASDSWFKTAKAISGDTGPPCRGPATPGIYEGEVATDLSMQALESIGFTAERLFLSEGSWSGRPDVIAALSDGCGFIDMAGHGNPGYWGNFLPDAQSEEEMIDGLLLRDMPKLKNGEHLPFIVVGGCHNAQFNVTMRNILHGIQIYGIRGMFFEPPFRFFYNEWLPRDFCTGLVFARRGGAIGSIGCSGLGLGYFNVVGLGDWLNTQFFNAYSTQTSDYVGDITSQALEDYITQIGGVNTDQGDRKTVEEWTLIGDPSLCLGGYP